MKRGTSRVMDRYTSHHFGRGIIYGLAVGALIGFGLSEITGPSIDSVRVFNSARGVSAMRIIRMGADGILVRNPNDSASYIPLNTYLENNVAPSDSAAERVRIEGIVLQE